MKCIFLQGYRTSSSRPKLTAPSEYLCRRNVGTLKQPITELHLLPLQVHPAERSRLQAERGAEGGAGDEQLSEGQPGGAAGPAGRGGAQGEGDR